MDKETFDKLLAKIPEVAEKKKKEIEENDLNIDFDEDRKEVYVSLWKIVYIFDQEGYRNFEKLWRKGVLTINKNNYLCVKDDWNDLIPIHRHFKLEEVEKLSKQLKCEIKDIHVHHINKKKEDNQLNNLEVLHKDEHAKRHGVNAWEQLIAIRMKNQKNNPQ